MVNVYYKIKLTALPLFVVMGLALLCGVYLYKKTTYTCKPSSRPQNVPEEAVWVGGTDGGCYCLLLSTFSDTCHFVIYNDFSGDTWYNGLFTCDQKNTILSEKDWRNLIEYYDGINIAMKDPYDTQNYIIWHPVNQ